MNSELSSTSSVSKTKESNATEVLAEQITDQLKRRMLEENPDGHLRRDTHAKMYGVVKAIFSVEAGLPNELAHGIFSEAKEYPAWIRFSNQSTQIKDDRKRDIRGMAIKLMGVPGLKLIAPETSMTTHDFIMISPSGFIAGSLREFADMLTALKGSLWKKLWFFATHWSLDLALLRSMIRIANPLHIPYHSTTPYALGDSVIKFCCRPLHHIDDAIPSNAGPDFLTEAMQQTFANGEALFEFCVQLQQDPVSMPIENPRKVWDPKVAPWRRVATIRIIQQDFNSTEQQQFGEKLSFNPWRCLEAHRPLGQINRARLLIYQAISKFRHDANHQDSSEPSDWNTL